MFKFLVTLITYTTWVCGSNLNTNNVIELELHSNNANRNSYFGYSLLLQKGNPSQVIVGAPKYRQYGGSVFLCDLSQKKDCRQYDIEVNPPIYNNLSMNGNFLGQTIDGDEKVGSPFVACAPRHVIRADFLLNDKNVLLGQCILHPDSASISSKSNYLYVQFVGSTTFSSQIGFDIFYRKDKNDVLIGGVGPFEGRGGIVERSFRIDPQLYRSVIEPITIKNNVTEYHTYDYLGYKVGTADYQQQQYIIGGAPRAADCVGKVVFFHRNQRVRKILGENDELGSYFGSSFLAVDVNNDQSDELFVGAPMAAGSTFDEGYVYYYKDLLDTSYTLKLYGMKRKAARFGTSVVNLGDINLDSYNDVAISAPFEDDGVGAVYIYMGSAVGIDENFSQRLTPSLFSPSLPNIRGFGLGISRGVDVNADSYNDLAIGAFKSDKVFVLLAKEIITVNVTFTSNVSALSVDKAAPVQTLYCLSFTRKSTKSNLSSVKFSVKIIANDVQIFSDQIDVDRQRGFCNTFDTMVARPLGDFAPYQITFRSDAADDVIIEGIRSVTLSLPFLHNCKSSDMCLTNLSVSVQPRSADIILSTRESLNFNVTVENSGDPGYQCLLDIILPEELTLARGRGCSAQNQNVTCLLGNRLDSSKWIDIEFRFLPTSLMTQRTRNVHFEISCLHSLNRVNATAVLSIKIDNSPYVDGKSLIDTLELLPEDLDMKKELETVHSYTVGNMGPSPARSDLYILIPVLPVYKKNLFEIAESRRNNEANKNHCSVIDTPMLSNEKYDVSSRVKTPLNTTLIVDCYHDWKCVVIFCEGKLLSEISETTTFNVKLKTTVGILGQFFRRQTGGKKMVAFVSSGIVATDMKIISHASTALVLSNAKEAVPIWIYLVSTIIGCFLLVLLILALFKCNFFKRGYRDKLIEERAEILQEVDDYPISDIPLDPMEIREENEDDEGEEQMQAELRDSKHSTDL